jgi:hypothetical protein
MMLVFAASAFGCDEKKEEAKPAPAPTTPAAPAPTAAAPTTATPTPAGGDKAAADATKAAGEMGKALGDAMKAAGEAKGGTPCETAFNSMEAMMKALEKNMPPGGKKAELPAKDKFVAACKELPDQVQQCMTMDYAMGHQKECMEAQSKLDPAKMAKMKELMGKK